MDNAAGSWCERSCACVWGPAALFVNHWSIGNTIRDQPVGIYLLLLSTATAALKQVARWISCLIGHTRSLPLSIYCNNIMAANMNYFPQLGRLLLEGCFALSSCWGRTSPQLLPKASSWPGSSTPTSLPMARYASTLSKKTGTQTWELNTFS